MAGGFPRKKCACKLRSSTLRSNDPPRVDPPSGDLLRVDTPMVDPPRVDTLTVDPPSGDPSTVLEKKKKGRNIDHLDHHPPLGKKFVVEWINNYLQHKGPNTHAFKKKINNITKRCEILFPLDSTWTNQKKESFAHALDYIKAEFDLQNNQNVQYYIFFSTGHHTSMT